MAGEEEDGCNGVACGEVDLAAVASDHGRTDSGAAGGDGPARRRHKGMAQSAGDRAGHRKKRRKRMLALFESFACQ